MILRTQPPIEPKITVVVDRGSELVTKIRDSLATCGYTCTQFSDSEEVVEFCRTTPVSIAIIRIDYVGGTTGVRLADTLKQLRPDIRTVLISRYNKEHLLRVPGFLGHVSDFISTPFTRAELLQKLNLVAGKVARR
jgi:CheY-like chemotaxis protein